jgi:hypothetical protein
MEDEIKKQLTRDLFGNGIDFFDFDYPEGCKCKTSLANVLEEDVPEKYFLSDEKTQKLLMSLGDSKEKATTTSEEFTEWGG